MDFGNPGLILSSIFVSLVGCAMFMYGRKQQRFQPLIAGVVLCVYPYFVSSLVVLWLLFGGVLAGLYAFNRWIAPE